MAEVRQKMRGTTAELDAVTSLVGHLVYDTQTHNLRIYDGVTPGGHKILTRAQLALDTAVTAYNATRLNSQLASFYLNSTNQNAGTLNDARLPATMSAKTFTSTVTINHAAGNPALYFNEAGVNRGVIFNDDALDRFIFRKYSTAGVLQADLSIYGAGATDLKFGGNTVWTAGNDGAASTLDADLLDGQHGSFYQNASNLNAGTIADARLPTTMAGKTFSSALAFSSTVAIVATTATSLNEFYGGTSGNGAHLALYGGSHATLPNQLIADANTINFRNQAGTGVPILQAYGNTIWHAGNDGAGSTLDSDLLDGQHGSYYLNGANFTGTINATQLNSQAASFYQNASNLNAGTIADARLPESMANKYFTGYIGLPGSAGNSEFRPGNGDGASYTTSNIILKGHWGMRMSTYNDSVQGYYDFRVGKWDTKGGFFENGIKVGAFAGQIAWSGCTSGAVPSGWLKCNGAAVSRTTYAALFAAISTTFGAGDGATTFNLPDLRGEFIRGWSDGSSVDSGRAFATKQSDALQDHRHMNGQANTSGSGANTIGSGPDANQYYSSYVTDARVANETRPRNMALLAVIKY